MDKLMGPLKKYTVWQGRAHRSEYWYFILFTLLINAGLTMIDIQTGTFDEATRRGLLSSLFTLAILLPSIAVMIRRLHDTGRSGWWFWIGLVPLIGTIVLLVFLCLDSEDETNQYGPNPKRELLPTIDGPGA